MPRQKLPALVGGLNTLVDPLVADMGQSPDCSDILGQRGLLKQRFGYDIRDIEPSHTNDSGGTTKTRGYLLFDGTNDNASNTSWTQTLGQKWTIRWEINFFTLAANFTDGTRIALLVKAATQNPVRVSLIGVTSGATCKVRVTVRDSAGNQIVLDSAARTSAAWLAAYANGSARYIRITRDGATLSLYIGETLEDSDTGFTTNDHEVATAIYVGSDETPGNYAPVQVYSNLLIVNRVLSETEAYFGISYPTDDIAESDVLGNWLFNEFTGTTVTDYSLYAKNLTISGATWTNSSHTAARGLGLFTHRTRAGRRYHIVFSTRRGTSSAGAAPSGVMYAWDAGRDFLPFHIGGDPANDDATATLTGLNSFARWDGLSVGDLFLCMNGRDFARKYGGTTPAARYMSIAAPPTGPTVAMVGSGGALSAGTYRYVQTFYNSNTGTESGRSPVIEATAAANDSATISLIYSSDPQVTHIRIYRTGVGLSAFTLLPQGEVANTTTAVFTDTHADTKIANNLQLDGVDAAGNGRRKRLYFPGGPPTVPDVVINAGGSVNTGAHLYAYSWYNPTTGQESGMSPAFTATTTAGNNTVALGGVTPMVLPDQNSGYTQMRLYRTKAGLREWYLRDTFSSAGTYSDTTADASLSTTIETQGLPPKCRYACLFANRLIMTGDPASPSTVYVSTYGQHEDFPILSAHNPNAGAEATALAATQSTLFCSFNDSRVYALPHPGDEVDLSYFLPINMREFSSRGGAVSHYSVENTDLGLVWLGRDGFYSCTEDGVIYISPLVTPEFLSLNRVRARYAWALYIPEEQLYLCWVSRGNKRLNEEAFVLDLRQRTWTIWKVHADVAGVLIDGTENPHYCFIMENGVLCEFDTSSSEDGDASGTQSGAVSGASPTHFTAIVGYTEPTGGDGGYPVYFKRASDGAVEQRYILDSGIGIPADDPTFYPSLAALTSGSWTAYLNGIRGLWTTMKTELGDARPDKRFDSLFVTHGKQSAGDLKVEVSADEEAFETANGSPVDLDDLMTSQVAVDKAGRYLQMRFTHDPPAADEPWKIVGVEVEGDLGPDVPQA